jgi:prolipoprotein diacylglyceryltransferase
MLPFFEIRPYGVLQLLAAVAFLALLERNLRRRHASLGTRPWIVAIAVLAAGIGGRLHYVIEKAAGGSLAIADIPGALAIGSSGSTFFGAMAGILIALVIVRRWLPGGSLARLADDAVPGLGAAILLGRIGCLLQGCCLGEPSELPWALPPALREIAGFPHLHPLALYLGLWACASALAASALTSSALTSGALSRRIAALRGWPFGSFSRPAIEGGRALVFLTLFSAGRAVIETYRWAPDGADASLGWALAESCLLAVTGALVLAARMRRKPLTVGSRLPTLG